MNIPADYRLNQNFSKIFKRISKDYVSNIKISIKELISIVLFPILWIKLIFQGKSIIRFFKNNSKKVPSLGTICSFSYMDINHYRSIREKESLNSSLLPINEVDSLKSFHDMKYINSVLVYNVL
jgi:hypothetical protein